MRTNTLSIFRFAIPFGLLWRRHRPAAARHERPDRATLRDLGLDASEWWSVHAEAEGRADPTRRRIEPHADGAAA
jgi:hypothetical protein